MCTVLNSNVTGEREVHSLRQRSTIEWWRLAGFEGQLKNKHNYRLNLPIRSLKTGSDSSSDSDFEQHARKVPKTYIISSSDDESEVHVN